VIEVAGERVRLIPWVAAVVKEVDLAGRRVRVDWQTDW
jgi:ribosomal 30S subunit maturation factor RimM